MHNNSKPTHHLPDGTFRNNYLEKIEKPISDLLSWSFERMGNKNQPIPLPSLKMDIVSLKQNNRQPTISWLGHASLLLQLEGFNILTDPHLSNRASPVSFAGPKRISPIPIQIEDLPRIDLILISHNHYDHLDETTLLKIYHLQQKPPDIFVPLRLGKWFLDRGMTTFVELDWWQNTETEAFTIHCVPAQHWSSRSMWDRSQTLWAGWVLESKQSDFRFYFVGDTGYSRDFKDIGQRFGHIDLAAIPIGAYAPRWFMKEAHITPEEAVQIYKDIQTRYAIGIHWGSFMLSDEPMDEPPKRLTATLDQRRISRDHFFVMKLGETKNISYMSFNP